MGLRGDRANIFSWVALCWAGDIERNHRSHHGGFTMMMMMMMMMCSHCSCFLWWDCCCQWLYLLHRGYLPTISLETLQPTVLVPKFCVSFGRNSTSLLGRHTSSMLYSSLLMIIDFPFLNLLGWLPGSSTASEASGACRETICQGERVKADV